MILNKYIVGKKTQVICLYKRLQSNDSLDVIDRLKIILYLFFRQITRNNLQPSAMNSNNTECANLPDGLPAYDIVREDRLNANRKLITYTYMYSICIHNCICICIVCMHTYILLCRVQLLSCRRANIMKFRHFKNGNVTIRTNFNNITAFDILQ